MCIFSSNAKLVQLADGCSFVPTSEDKISGCWEGNTYYGKAFQLALDNGLIEPSSINVMITDGAPNDSEPWYHHIQTYNQILDSKQGGRMEAYFLGNESTFPNSHMYHTLELVCSPGIKPKSTNAAHFEECVRSKFAYSLRPVFGPDSASVGLMTAHFLLPEEAETYAGDLVEDIKDAKMAASVLTVLVAFIKHFGTQPGFPFLNATKQLKALAGRFSGKKDQLYGFASFIQSLNMFAAKEGVRNADFGDFSNLFAAAQLCVMQTPDLHTQSDAAEAWNDVLEKALVMMANNPIRTRAGKKTDKARIKMISRSSATIGTVRNAFETVKPHIVNRFPNTGFTLARHQKLQEEFIELKASTQSASELPSAAAVINNPGCAFFPTTSTVSVNSFADHRNDDEPVLLQVFTGVPSKVNAELLKIVFWRLTQGTIVSENGPLALLNTMIFDILTGLPPNLCRSFAVLDMIKHYANNMKENPFETTTIIAQHSGVYWFGAKQDEKNAEIARPEWALIAPLVSSSGPFSVLHDECCVSVQALESQIKSSATEEGALEWLREIIQPGRHLELLTSTEVIKQCLLPVLQHAYAYGAMPRSKEALSEMACASFPVNAELFLSNLEKINPTDEKASALLRDMLSGVVMTVPLDNDQANALLQAEISELLDKKVMDSSTRTLPGVAQAALLRLNEIAKLALWQLMVAFRCPPAFVQPLMTLASSFDVMMQECAEFKDAFYQAGWEIVLANHLNGSKLGGSEFARQTRVTRPRVVECVDQDGICHRELKVTIPNTAQAFGFLNERFVPSFVHFQALTRNLDFLSSWRTFVNLDCAIAQNLNTEETIVAWPVFLRLFRLDCVQHQEDLKMVLLKRLDYSTIKAKPAMSGWTVAELLWWVENNSIAFDDTLAANYNKELFLAFSEACARVSESKHVEQLAKIASGLPGALKCDLILSLMDHPGQIKRFFDQASLLELALRLKALPPRPRPFYCLLLAAFLMQGKPVQETIDGRQLLDLLQVSTLAGPSQEQIKLAEVVQKINDLGVLWKLAREEKNQDENTLLFEQKCVQDLLEVHFNFLEVTRGVRDVAISYARRLRTAYNQNSFSKQQIFTFLCQQLYRRKAHPWFQNLVHEHEVDSFETFVRTRMGMERYTQEQKYGKKLALHTKAFRVLPYVTFDAGEGKWKVPEKVQDRLTALVF